MARDLLGSPNARNLWNDERAEKVELARNRRKIIRTWKVESRSYMSQLKEDFAHLYQGNHGKAIKVGKRKEECFAGKGDLHCCCASGLRRPHNGTEGPEGP